MTSNSKMRKLLEKIDEDNTQCTALMNIKELQRLLFPPFKKIGDCLIIADEAVPYLESYFLQGIELNTDKTGYEASNTETRINSYFNETITVEFGIQVAILTAKIWTPQLKALEPEAKICFIIIGDSDDGHVELRFHKVRSGERWLADDIESYTNDPIGYFCV